MEEAFTSSAWFNTETFVAMADGSMQEIQFIGVGAMVQSIDFATGLICGRRVTRVLVQEQMPIVRVHYRVEPSHEEMPLQTTPRSPFRVGGQRWVTTLDFVAGDVIATASRRNATVSRVVPQRYLADVHCLDVEGFESYLVGSERLIVCRSTSSG